MLKVGAKRRRTRQQIHEDGLAAQVQAHLAEQLQAQKNELEAQLIAQQQQNEAANQEASSGAAWLDIEVRAGRSKILLCCRLPAAAGESAALIQRLRLTLSRLCNAPLPESPEASECRGHGQASSNAGHGQARDQTRSPSPSASPEQRRVSQKGGGRGCSKLPYRIGRQARQLGYM